MRLLTFLQSQGISRRTITQGIKEKKIVVRTHQGVSSTVESFSVELKNGDRITYEKQEYMYKENEISTEKKIVLFNKPVGYVVSKSDPHNATIFEILPKEFLQNFWYIGRLDKDSHGLLLLTNDSHLVHQYEHPSHDITKEYYVRLDNALSSKDLQECLKGVVSDDDLLRAVEIKALDSSNMYLSITLSE